MVITDVFDYSHVDYDYKILYKFMPVLYLHPDEKISPLSFEKYILKSELCVFGKRKTIQKTLFTPPETIREFRNVLINKGDIRLPLNNFYNNIPNIYLNYCGNYSKPTQPNLDLVPIYGMVRHYKHFIDIIYIFNYPYNESYKLFGMYIGGQHQADIEYIRVRIDNNNFFNDIIPITVKKIFYSAHNDNQGMWVKGKDVHWENGKINTRPIVYVSKDNHANYPWPGTWLRMLGFANDITTKKNAIIWKPNTVINLKQRDDLMSFRGKMGNNGVTSLYRDWDDIPPNNKSSFTNRFFNSFFTKINCLNRN